MTTEQVEQHLRDSTATLSSAHTEVASAETTLAIARQALQKAVTHHTLNGLEGKNDTARKAELAELCQTEHDAVTTAEHDLTETKLALELAKLDHQLARHLNRLHIATLTTLKGEQS